MHDDQPVHLTCSNTDSDDFMNRLTKLTATIGAEPDGVIVIWRLPDRLMSCPDLVDRIIEELVAETREVAQLRGARPRRNTRVDVLARDTDPDAITVDRKISQ